MAEYGITDDGFVRKRLDLLLQEINDAVRGVFGENINLTPQSPDGQINGIVAGSNADLWEIAEDAYNAFNPSAATGDTLSSLVQLNGITRLPATFSRATLTITGANGTNIPGGSLVTTSDTGETFATDVAVVIAGGTAEVTATCLVTGPVQAVAGTLTKIDNPITGWQTVTNAADATVGTDEETDAALRARRELSVQASAQAILDSIYAGIAEVPNVTQLTVLENDTDVVDVNGLPPHSFRAIVVGGDDDDIAAAIWSKKPAGIKSDGTTVVVVPDIQGFPHDIGFSRPTLVPIEVVVDISIYDPNEFPGTGEQQIKDAIVSYANANFLLGEDVIYSRLFTPINSVPGQQVNSLEIAAIPGPLGTANIPIAVGEISQFLDANITVSIT